MTRKLVVAGIGTEIGKTVGASIICEALHADYWKPIQAGDLDLTDAMKVKSWLSNKESKIHPEAFRLNHPLSPHAAAALDDVKITPESIQLPETTNNLVIEMAGGLMVPLTKDYLYIDWVKASKCPVILISCYYLGSINHTLMSWEVLQKYEIPVLGIIFNGKKNLSSHDVILHRTQVRCLLEINKEKKINKEIIQRYARKLSAF